VTYYVAMETKWTPQAEHNFTTLLTTWNNHQALRTNGAAPAELWNSRTELDHARLTAFPAAA